MQTRERCLLRRLQHDAVAVDERRRHLPGGNRGREVPRCDQADDAERAPQRVEGGARRGLLVELALRPPGLAGEVAEDRRGAGRLHARFAQRLAHLPGHVCRHLLDARFDCVSSAHQHGGAPGRRGVRPAGEGLRRGLDRRSHVLLAGRRKLADDLAGVRGIVLLVRAAVPRRRPFAADVVGELRPCRRLEHAIRHESCSFRREEGRQRRRPGSRACRSRGSGSRPAGRVRARPRREGRRPFR